MCTYLIIFLILLTPFMGLKKEDKQLSTSDRISEKIDGNNSSNDKRKGTVKMLQKKAHVNDKDLDDPAVERDVGILIKKYLRGDALFDILANIPFLVYTIVYGIP